MSFFYDIAMMIATKLTNSIGFLLRENSHNKFVRFLSGRVRIWEKIRKDLILNPDKLTVWLHAASLGEFAIARPIISELRDKMNIVVTFFSPSGYDVIKADGRNYCNVFYLPWDTKKNAERFIDEIRPDVAVFMVSEFWHNYLGELNKRNIPTFLVSALIRRKSVFFKWYGGAYRKDLKAFTHIFSLDELSTDNLRELSVNNVSTSGDPLFDNAYAIAGITYTNTIVERFKKGENLFIAGSVSDANDLKLISSLANEFPDTRFIIVPHTISKESLNEIVYHLKGKALLYSECDATTDFSDAQTLIIDFIGALAYLYRYGTWAYIGGGFTPFLHSVIEPIVYGLPISFGPKIHRKITPTQLIELGIGRKVSNYNQLKAWFVEIKDDSKRQGQIRETARRYVRDNIGATHKIAEMIENAIER